MDERNWISVKDALPDFGHGAPYMTFITKPVLMRGEWRKDYPVVGHFVLEEYNGSMGCNIEIPFEHSGGYKFYSARCPYIDDQSRLAPAYKNLLPIAFTKAVTHWCRIPQDGEDSRGS